LQVDFQKIKEKAMEVILSLFNMLIDFFKTEYSIFGMTFSFWQFFVLGCLAAILGLILKAIFS